MSGLSNLRQRRGLTQTELARRLGISGAQLSRLESGKREVRLKSVPDLARALGCAEHDVYEAVVTGSKPLRARGAPERAQRPRRRRSARAPATAANIGPFRDEDAARQTLRNRLVCALSPEAVYLIGSRAEGRHRPDSDFDFVVVFPDAAGEAGRDYDRAYAPLVGLGVACDVVPCLVSDFDQDRHEPDSLARACVTTGSLEYLRHGAVLPWLAPNRRGR